MGIAARCLTKPVDVNLVIFCFFDKACMLLFCLIAVVDAASLLSMFWCNCSSEHVSWFGEEYIAYATGNFTASPVYSVVVVRATETGIASVLLFYPPWRGTATES